MFSSYLPFLTSFLSFTFYIRPHIPFLTHISPVLLLDLMFLLKPARSLLEKELLGRRCFIRENSRNPPI